MASSLAVLLAVAAAAAAGAAAAPPAAACHRQAAAESGSCSGARLGVALLQTRHERASGATAAAKGEEIHSGDLIFLKVARTGTRLTAEKDGKVHAKWDHRGGWQQFAIEKATGAGTIEDGDKVFLTAWTGKRISVQNETVHAKWDHKGSWQMLTLSRQAGPGPVTNGDSIFLRGHLDKNLDADAPGSKGGVRARYEDAGSWQELVVEAIEPRTTTTTTTAPAPGCVERQSLGMCQPCLHTEQCEVGSYCCPYMKKCVASSGAGCFAPVAQCVPMCSDGQDPHACECENEDFPDNWQLRTCEDGGSGGGAAGGDASGGNSAAGGSSEGQAEVSAEAWEHFRLLNELRSKGFTCPHGASFAPNPDALRFDCRLWRAAKLHAEDMVKNGYFSHTSQDGRSPWKRADDQGTTATGENIVAGRSGANSTLQQLEASDHHCKNMLNPGFKVAAVGHAAGGYYKHYWTQMFSEVDASDIDTSCYPPGTSEPSLLAVAVGAAQLRNGGEGRDDWEGVKLALLEPAVRTSAP